MTDFYLYLSSRDSIDVRENNNPSDFWIPKTYALEGQWVCALKQISLTCNLKPQAPRLYLCCHIVEESYVRNTTLPILRNIEIANRYKQFKCETFDEGISLPVNVTNLSTVRLYLLDTDLHPVQFESEDLHCLLHFKQNGFNRSIRY